MACTFCYARDALRTPRSFPGPTLALGWLLLYTPSIPGYTVCLLCSLDGHLIVALVEARVPFELIAPQAVSGVDPRERVGAARVFAQLYGLVTRASQT